MLDLEKIKRRLEMRFPDGFVGVAVDSGAQWVKDIRALVAEVERLRGMVMRDPCPEEIALTKQIMGEEDDALQSCGHPRSAIVSDHDLGGDRTGYCSMCLADARRPPIALKSDWKLPDPPKCEHGEVAIAAAHWTGDSWAWGWDTDCCGPDPFNWGDDGEPNMIGAKIEWPFVENMARPKDWKHAGFEER